MAGKGQNIVIYFSEQEEKIYDEDRKKYNDIARKSLKRAIQRRLLDVNKKNS